MLIVTLVRTRALGLAALLSISLPLDVAHGSAAAAAPPAAQKSFNCDPSNYSFGQRYEYWAHCPSTSRKAGFHASRESASAHPEADLVVTQLWNKLLTKCGDTYLYGSSSLDSQRPDSMGRFDPHQHNTVYAFKSASFVLHSSPLTAADHLNGVEFHGEIRIAERLFNWRDDSGRWSTWEDVSPDPVLVYGIDSFFVQIRKTNGRWYFTKGNAGTFEMSEIDVNKPSCSILPS